MAIAPYAVRPSSPALPEPSTARENGDLVQIEAKPECSPDEILVTTLLERSAADVGWLAWGDGKDAVVVPAVVRSFLNPAAIGEFPEPPRESVVVDRGKGDGPWALWCRARGILSWAISPIYARGRVVGVIGLASCRAGALADYDVDRLQLVSSLAG